MRCLFDYCLYNKNFLCTQEEIQINSSGSCEGYIPIHIPGKILKEIKKRQQEEN